MNHRQRKFFEIAIGRLVESGISVNISQSDEVMTPQGLPCTGFFDDKTRLLGIACDGEGWMDYFVHEYCHFQQWAEGKFLADPENLFEQWLVGKVELPQEEMLKLVKYHQECELDCERRTVKNMWVHGLRGNLEEYIQLANSYVLYFNVVAKQRKWPDDGPYCEEILATVPKKWLDDISDYHMNMPEGYEEAVLKHCFDIDQ